MMRMIKTIVAMTVVLATLLGFAGDSVPLLLDIAEETRVAREVETISYSTTWDNGTTVRVAVDGVTLKEVAAPASGVVTWDAAKAGEGLHTLTHTTYANGVAGKVETATFYVDHVTDVIAKPRHPWNGMVDITCKVRGINGTTNGLKFAMAMVVPDAGITRSVSCFWVVKDGVKTTDRRVHTNGDYRLLWDARTDFGLVINTKMIVRVTLAEYDLTAHDKVQLWESGPYWATTNIGAEDPEDYGYYFWWGDTVGYRRENNAWVASDGSTANFSFDSGNTPTYYKTNATLRSEGWITADGVLAPAHDAAQAHWGGKWRMPTKDEISALNNNCDWSRTTMNDVNGYVVRGRGDYATASIFLPCAGYGIGASLDNAGSDGFYWSSVPGSDSYYYFYSSSHRTNYSYDRNYGQSVRPVQGFSE